jgi:hypothetical protein
VLHHTVLHHTVLHHTVLSLVKAAGRLLLAAGSQAAARVMMHSQKFLRPRKLNQAAAQQQQQAMQLAHMAAAQLTWHSSRQ